MSGGWRGAVPVAEHGFSGAPASVVAAHGLVVVTHGLHCPSACGIKPMSPALAGRLLSIGPPGKTCLFLFLKSVSIVTTCKIKCFPFEHQKIDALEL